MCILCRAYDKESFIHFYLHNKISKIEQSLSKSAADGVISCFCMILKRRDMLMLTVVPADYQSDTLNRDIVLFHILSLSNLYTSSKTECLVLVCQRKDIVYST